MSVQYVNALKENQTIKHNFNTCLYLSRKWKECVEFAGIKTA